MKVLKPTTDAQTIDILTREHTSTTYEVTLIDEESREATITNLSGSYVNGRVSFDISYDFIDKSFYFFKVNVGTSAGDYVAADYAADDYYLAVGDVDEIYRGKIWVTNQTDFEKYNAVNNYVENETTNTFKVRR